MNINPDITPDDGNSALDQVIAVIDECFESVDDLKGLDTFITTEDIFEAVQSFYPGDHYAAADIVDMMIRSGFRFTAHPSSNLQFVWLLKRR
jgi:hypothetical protein